VVFFFPEMGILQERKMSANCPEQPFYGSKLLQYILTITPIGQEMKRGIGFWSIQGPGWLLLLYLIFAQAIPAFDYDLGVSMGTQEPAEQITEVGVAFWYGFAFGDLITYIPLLAMGLIGYCLSKAWGRMLLAAALGITVYWPAVCLAAVVAARGATGWNLTNEAPYWIVLPLIALWGTWGLWFLVCSGGNKY
jgi:hypothetical protein